MIKAIVIDDERLNREFLQNMLEQEFDNVEVVAVADSALSGSKVINQHQPDVVFLDVEMPGGSGFDLLEIFPERDFKVIFVTAYNKYAIQAIKEKAFDYIMKPIDVDELKKSMQSLIEEREKTAILSDKIVINTLKETYFILFENIIRLESSGNYCSIFLTDGSCVVATRQLKSMMGELPENIFFRTHKSHVINIRFVTKLNKSEGDNIVMQDKSEVPLSRRRKEEFLELFSK